MDLTRDITALEELPEAAQTALCGHRYKYVDIQVNINACYYTCNVTQINEA